MVLAVESNVSKAVTRMGTAVDSNSAKDARILVVDDDQEMMAYISGILASAGFHVVCAHNGAVALELLRKTQPPDMVISDLRMPRVDGLSLLSALRGAPETAYVPFIVVSGFDDSKVRGLEEGANDYVTKPFDSAELVARVRSHLRQARVSAKWRAETWVDPLTGLLNRRGFIEHAERELHRAVRHQTSLSLVFTDVDGFKQLNDWFGHSFGDQVLRDVAGVLDHSLRGCDLAGRWGGDEFVLLLPGSGRLSARRVALRIERQVDRLVDVDGFGLSSGIACLFEDVPAEGEGVIEALISFADRQMYRSKRERHQRFAVGTDPGIRSSR